MENSNQLLKKHLSERFPHLRADEIDEATENLLTFAQVITGTDDLDGKDPRFLTDSETSSTIESNQ